MGVSAVEKWNRFRGEKEKNASKYEFILLNY